MRLKLTRILTIRVNFVQRLFPIIRYTVFISGVSDNIQTIYDNDTIRHCSMLHGKWSDYSFCRGDGQGVTVAVLTVQFSAV